MKPADMDPTLCNNSVLRQAARQLGQLYDDIISPSGLRATQFGLLAYVVALDRPTMAQLASALVMDLSALGHTLKPLIRDGLVETFPDERDRRAKRVKLTAVGEQKVKAASALWAKAQGAFETAFGKKRAAELRKVLSFVASDAFGQAFVAAKGSS
ncbi:MarR family winged helix-turn-helix transcriptional regulator [Pseudorhodoplanes sinuspersici]|nr:MarR family transcriptional regulator [Pseudorhodoplanes sinuspersici]